MYKILFMTTTMLGTLLTMTSNNWLGMWMGLEMNLLSIIPLMSSQKNSHKSEAAMKYFITQAMTSTILLISMLTVLSDLNSMKTNSISTIQSMIMDSSLLTKMGAAPFHFWFPEIMEGLSWTNSLIMLTWQKIAPMTILMNTTKPEMFIAIIILSSMTISGLMGVNQTSLRKIMTYSSINHIGWMMGSMISNQSIWLIYLAIYSMISAIIISLFMKLNSYHINQLMNSLTQSKQLKILFNLNFLSLGGLPPFIGFFPKWLTINSMIDHKMFALTLTMIILTLMTLFFYMRITFSSLMIMTHESTIKNQVMPSTTINMLNAINIMALPMCTLILNFT